MKLDPRKGVNFFLQKDLRQSGRSLSDAFVSKQTSTNSVNLSNAEVRISKSQGLDKSLHLAAIKAQEGNLEASRSIYVRILKDYPKNKIARKNLKIIDKKISEAIDPPIKQYQPIISLFREGRFEDALGSAKKLLKKFPRSVILNSVCGASSAKLNNFDESIQSYESVIKMCPQYAEAHFNLGNVYLKIQNYADAITCFMRAIENKKDYIEAIQSLGETQRTVEDFGAAVVTFKLLVQCLPDSIDALFHLGLALIKNEEFENAVEIFSDVVSMDPVHKGAIFQLAEAYRKTRKYEEAITWYEDFIKIDPNYARAYCQIGICKAFQNDLDASIAYQKKALKIKANFFDAMVNLGNAYKDQGKLEKAIFTYNEALKIKPKNADAKFAKSLAYLAQGNFAKGWALYDHRWEIKTESNNYLSKMLEKPIWNLDSKGTVLLWSEQGIGDIVMFASMVLELNQLSNSLIIQTDERLIPLFRRSFPSDIQYFSSGSTVPLSKYDFQIPMGSLPKFFRPTLKSFQQTSEGYLSADPDQVSNLRSKLMGEKYKKIVGLSWLGGTDKSTYLKQRNIDLISLVGTIANDEIKFISLQHGDNFDEIREVETQLGITIFEETSIDLFEDLGGLASLICACDQVVSSDNSVGLLAGSLGRSTHVLLPKYPNWKWIQTENKSYWHSSVTTYHKDGLSNSKMQLERLKVNLDAQI
jgi:tetratricopeptide (TPR) repeat protein